MIDLRISKKAFCEAYFPYLFDYGSRYEAYYGGAGSGKSHFITQKVLIKCLREKRKALIIRKVSRTIKDSVFQLFLDILAQFSLLEYCKINQSNFTITLPNGSVLLFKGLDDSEKLKSITAISDIWVEEATEITLDEFTQLDLRLRANTGKLQMFLSFNPVSKSNWVYRHFFENGAPPDTFILKTTYLDNRFLPPEYVESLKKLKENNPTYYKIYALGEFCSPNKLVYHNWTVAEFDHRKLRGRLLVGLDFGFVNDPTALVASVLTDDGKLYVFDEYVETGLTNDKIACIIREKGFAKSVIIADSAEQKSIEEIRQYGISRIKGSVKGPGSVLWGIGRLKQLGITVHKKCKNTITELENYSWKKDERTGEYINEPIDEFNHCLDALRYSLQGTGYRLRCLSKDLLGL